MMPRVMWSFGELIVVFAVLAMVAALLSSRYYRLVLGVLGTLVGVLVAIAASYLVLDMSARQRLVLVPVQGQSRRPETDWPSKSWETEPRDSSLQPLEPMREGAFRVHVPDGCGDESPATQAPGAVSAVQNNSPSRAPYEQVQAAQGPDASSGSESIDSSAEGHPSAESAAPEALAPESLAPETLPNAPVGKPRSRWDAASFGEPQPMAGDRAGASGEATQMGARSASDVMHPQPPEWLTAPTGKQADGSYRLIVKSGPFKTRIECDKELRPIVAQEVDAYVELLLGRETVRRALGDRFRGSTLLAARELDGLVRKTWLEQGEAAWPVGDVVTVHALVVFTPQIQSRIESRFREQVSQRRAAQAIVGSAGLLGLLATVYGYLRFDMLTRGYYTGRLRLAAVAMILAIVGGTAAYFLA